MGRFFLLEFKERIERGFTLVELMVVISIIVILAVVGITLFQGAQKGTRDAKKKADVNTIAAAYEENFDVTQDSYIPLTGGNFASGERPVPPEGGSYNGLITTAAEGYQVCAALEDNPTPTCDSPSPTCYCRSSFYGPTPTSPPPCDPAPLLTGLAGYWKLDDGTGTTAADSSSNNTSGTLTNGPTWTTGKFTSALNFSATGAPGTNLPTYVNIPGMSPPLANLTAGNYTFAAWVYPTAIPSSIPNRNYATIIGNYGTVPFFLGYSDQQRMVMNVYDNVYPYQSYTAVSANTFAPNQWYLVVGVVDTTTSTILIYVNGNPEGSTTYSGSLFSGYVYTIGAQDISMSASCTSTDWAYCFGGKIDDARIYNRALSASEISSLYNGGSGCVP